MSTNLMIAGATPAGPIEAHPRVDLIASFLSGRSPRTMKAYRFDLAHFARFVGAACEASGVQVLISAPPGDANHRVLMYKVNMLDSGLATATIARRLAAIRSVVKLARTLGLVNWNLEVEGPRVEKRRDTRGPDRSGWSKLWKAAKARGDGPKGRRDRAILSLLYDLALRRGEVVSLDLADVDLRGKTVAVVGKGRREAVRITLAGPTARALAEWIEVRGDEPGPLFHRLDKGPRGALDRLSGDAVAELVAELGRAARLDRPVRPHGLRHAAITQALNNGADLRDVRKFSRHRKLETVLLYDDERRDVAGEIARKLAGDRR